MVLKKVHMVPIDSLKGKISINLSLNILWKLAEPTLVFVVKKNLKQHIKNRKNLMLNLVTMEFGPSIEMRIQILLRRC